MGAVTLTDVAARAGVSQPTASRVLNGSARKPAPQVVAAVRKAAEELGYVPNAQAQALARSATGLIGLVVQDIADPYFSAVAAGIQQVTMARHRQLMLAATLRDPLQELAVVEAFIAHRTEAIILVGSRWSTPEAVAASVRLDAGIARYIINGGRVAVIGQPIPGADAVVPSNRTSAAAFANALVATGLRDFVVLSGPSELTVSRDRAGGFITALRKAGIRPRGVVDGDFTRDGGYAAASRAITTLSLRTQPACLFAVNDVMALGASAALRDAGLHIPNDVQLAGFDDIPTLRDHQPELSTVRLPMHSMGERVAELALDKDATKPVIVRVRGTVMLRESTRPNGGQHVAPQEPTTEEQPTPQWSS
jgi:LacI family transcriptional regulator